MTWTPSRTTGLLVAGAAVVIVIGGIKAANSVVTPVLVALALTIVFYPLRVQARAADAPGARVGRSCCSPLSCVLLVDGAGHRGLDRPARRADGRLHLGAGRRRLRRR